MPISTTLVMALLQTASPRPADVFDPEPAPDRRIVDPSGRYYLVLKSPGGAGLRTGRIQTMTMSIAERRPGTPPVTNAFAEYSSSEQNDSWTLVNTKDVVVREGDTLLGQCQLTPPPDGVWISSSGLGVAEVQYLPFGRSDSVVVRMISLNGTLRFERTLADLLPRAEWDRFRRTTYDRIFWVQGTWIDEERRSLLVAPGRPAREVAPGEKWLVRIGLERGEVERVGSEFIIQGLVRATEERDADKLWRCVDFAFDLGLRDAAMERALVRVVADKSTATYVRLRAAHFLHRTGKDCGTELFPKVASGAVQDLVDRDNVRGGTRAYAIENLPAMLGERALPVLKAVLLERGVEEYTLSFEEAFAKLGEKGVPILLPMLEDRSHQECRDRALRLLGKLGHDARGAVPSLIKLLGDKSKVDNSLSLRVQNYAASVLGRIGRDAQSALPALEQMVLHGDAEARTDALKAIERIRQ